MNFKQHMNNTTLNEIQNEITYIKIPEGVDIDLVSEILYSEDELSYDLIFLKNGIVCSNERIDDVKEAIKEAQEDSDEE